MSGSVFHLVRLVYLRRELAYLSSNNSAQINRLVSRDEKHTLYYRLQLIPKLFMNITKNDCKNFAEILCIFCKVYIRGKITKWNVENFCFGMVLPDLPASVNILWLKAFYKVTLQMVASLPFYSIQGIGSGLSIW